MGKEKVEKGLIQAITPDSWTKQVAKSGKKWQKWQKWQK